MKPEQRIMEIRQRLEIAFSPTQLEIIDDSVKHIGHAGSRNGAGHYTVIMTADSLKDKSRVDAHREIYALLADLIPDEVHALQIKL
jgi:BolA protein